MAWHCLCITNVSLPEGLALLLALLQVLTLCEEHNWDALEDFAAERKSPVGWEPFLDLAKKHGAPREVQAR